MAIVALQDTTALCFRGMGRDPKEIELALATVQRTLDRLTGTETAFEIARAQFAASVRASWPANLSGVAAAIDRALAEEGLSLTDTDRDELRRAADVLRAVEQP
jgi:hypothetical protein